nr:inovirus-type Gp2 protein [Erwinia endophytica]
MNIRDWLEYRTLVHFPNDPLAFLERNKPDFMDKLDVLTVRLCYMAKYRINRYNRALPNTHSAAVQLTIQTSSRLKVFYLRQHSIV